MALFSWAVDMRCDAAFGWLVAGLLVGPLLGCGGESMSGDASVHDGAAVDRRDPGDSGLAVDSAAPDSGFSGGCPIIADPIASEGDPIDGDTYVTFARGFFETYCTRCHSTTRLTAEERNNAPPDRDWDDDTSIRNHLPLIRMWVAEINGMPVGEPRPTCDERRRLARWIDAGAP